MPTSIPAVEQPSIEHGLLIDITVPDLANNGHPITFHISNCYTGVTYNSQYYSPLGGFMEISDLQGTLQNTVNEISVGISAIPAAYIQTILGSQIKGGKIKIYRVFFDTLTQTVLEDGVHQRFNGYITNFAVQENLQTSNKLNTIVHTLTITASSIIGILQTRLSGRRTNQKSYQVYYPETTVITHEITGDLSMNRVEALKNAQFDFGKKA